ncbi:MAG TPA: hypothetical protein VHV77_18020 [Pirellulales bacterium]|nr:hypothetical protein [Pirellulales bacterium]
MKNGMRWAVAVMIVGALTPRLHGQQASNIASAYDPEATQVEQVAYGCAQCARCGRYCQNPCPCPCPGTQPSAGAPTEAQPGEAPSPIQEPSTESPAVTPNANMFANNANANFGAARGAQSVAPNMFGDFLVGHAFQGTLTLTGSTIGAPDTQLGRGGASVPIASHVFKQADNESPFPRTRAIFTSNYFNNVGSDTGITRQLFGFEKLIGDGLSSIAVRVPIYTVAAGSQTVYGYGGQSQTFGTFTGETQTQTSVGDLTITYKKALLYDPRYGNILSAGVAVTAPTGPNTIGGGTALYTVNGIQHTGSIQPYMAFFRSLSPVPRRGMFLQGFLATDTPFNRTDSTFLYSDLGLGYIMRRNVRYGITAIVPMLEVHGNFALNKQQHTVVATQALQPFTSYTGIQGTVSYFDQVNMTAGSTFVINNRSTLSLAGGVPVSNPQPFNYELIAQWSTYFGPGLPPYLAR